MKNILVLLFFSFSFLTAATSRVYAFYLEQSTDMAAPYSPYPPVLSPAIDVLPQGFITIIVGDETFYYCNGVFYHKIIFDQKYQIVSPPIGAVVFNIPEGFQYMFIEGRNYYVYQGVYYRRVLEGFKVVYPPV